MSAVVWTLNALLGAVLVWREVKAHLVKATRRRYPRPNPVRKGA